MPAACTPSRLDQGVYDTTMPPPKTLKANVSLPNYIDLGSTALLQIVQYTNPGRNVILRDP